MANEQIKSSALKKVKKPEEFTDTIMSSFPSDEQLQASKQERKSLASRIAEKGGELGFPNLGAAAATAVDLSSDFIPDTREEYVQGLVPGVGSIQRVEGKGLDLMKKARMGKSMAQPLEAGDTLLDVSKSAMGEPGTLTYSKHKWGTAGKEPGTLDYSKLGNKR